MRLDQVDLESDTFADKTYSEIVHGYKNIIWHFTEKRTGTFSRFVSMYVLSVKVYGTIYFDRDHLKFIEINIGKWNSKVKAVECKLSCHFC